MAPAGADRADGIASVLGRRLRVRFLREWFYELRRTDGTRLDDYLEGPIGDLFERDADGWALRLPPGALERLEPDRLERVTVGADWKILEIVPEPEP